MPLRRIIAATFLSLVSAAAHAASADSSWTPWTNGSVDRPPVNAGVTFQLPEQEVGAPRCYHQRIVPAGSGVVFQPTSPPYDCPVTGPYFDATHGARRGDLNAASVRVWTRDLIRIVPVEPGRQFYDYWVRRFDGGLAYVTLEVVVR